MNKLHGTLSIIYEALFFQDKVIARNTAIHAEGSRATICTLGQELPAPFRDCRVARKKVSLLL